MVRALASHQFSPGSNPGVDAICGLSLWLVLSFAPRGFSPGSPDFPSPQNPTFRNSNSTGNQVDEEPLWLCGCATSKSLLLLLLLLLLLFLFTVIIIIIIIRWLTAVRRRTLLASCCCECRFNLLFCFGFLSGDESLYCKQSTYRFLKMYKNWNFGQE